MTDPFTVLISSAGRRVALLRSFRQAIKKVTGAEGRVLAADATPLSAAMWEADDRFVVPRCDESDYVSHMIDLCQAQNVDMLIPTIDTELPVLVLNQQRFRDVGTRVVISGPKTIELAADKLKTHTFLVEHDLPVGRQSEARNVPDDIATWGLPLIAKPRRGSASFGVRRVESLAELSSLPDDYVVEQLARGIEYTLDAFIDAGGECAVVVPRQRLETRSGEVSKGRTVRLPQLSKVARDVCSALPDAMGVLTVQAFFDHHSQRAHVIEINPRFGGGFPLSCKAGADFPRWLVEESLGLPTEISDTAWRDGLTMLRYDDAIFVDSATTGGVNG